MRYGLVERSPYGLGVNYSSHKNGRCTNSLDRPSIFLQLSKYEIGSDKEDLGQHSQVCGHAVSAMGTEPRLRIMQLLLSAHPDGLVVGDIQEELDIPNSTLSHHLEQAEERETSFELQRESTFLRYTANTEALQELLSFLYSECCTRNKAVKPEIMCKSANRRPDNEQHRHQGSGERKIRTGSLAGEEWGRCLLLRYHLHCQQRVRMQ